MLCRDIEKRFADFTACVTTDQGLRVTTHCLYPSFDPVQVFIVGFGDGFKIHDGGGAARCAWDHGKELNVARHAMSQQAAAYHLEVIEDALVGQCASSEWLMAAILGVANASAAAAYKAVGRPAASSEQALKDMIHGVLSSMFPKRQFGQEFAIFGKSGKRHIFDFVVHLAPERQLLIDAVSSHHVSIAAKYVAFADTGEPGSGRGFAVYDRELDPDDAALMGQVADLVPFRAFQSGVARERII